MNTWTHGALFFPEHKHGFDLSSECCNTYLCRRHAQRLEESDQRINANHALHLHCHFFRRSSGSCCQLTHHASHRLLNFVRDPHNAETTTSTHAQLQEAMQVADLELLALLRDLDLVDARLLELEVLGPADRHIYIYLWDPTHHVLFCFVCSLRTYILFCFVCLFASMAFLYPDCLTAYGLPVFGFTPVLRTPLAVCCSV